MFVWFRALMHWNLADWIIDFMTFWLNGKVPNRVFFQWRFHEDLFSWYIRKFEQLDIFFFFCSWLLRQCFVWLYYLRFLSIACVNSSLRYWIVQRMVLSLCLNGVSFIGTRQLDLGWSRDLSLFGFCQSKAGRKAINKSIALRIQAVAAKQDLNFKDPEWKKLYEEEFDERFNLPHLSDVLDVKPRPTTFALQSRWTSHF